MAWMDGNTSSGFRRASRALALGVALCGAAASAQAAERAKNVILFIGDGMGVSTLTAARIFEGQRRGVDGASNRLSFEAFPDLALVRTYSADSLVTESAAGASAILTGRRTLNGALGVNDKVVRGDCASAKTAQVPTLAELAKRSGRATGVVSSAAITDATPASLYAHTPSRQWQADADLPPEAVASGCTDIARQMLDGPAALQLDVMLGGGLAAFTPAEGSGRRLDGRDLTVEWRKSGGAYVETGSALAAVPASTRRLLGLFGPGNMMRETTRRVSEADAPRLVEMTLKAIEVLSNDPDGYFLMVEGGLIDKAHHEGLAYEALNEVAELSEAVAAAMAKTDPADTLILVTADHSHGLTLSGGSRSTSVLGLLPGTEDDPATALDGKPVSILMYATGPGAPATGEARPDLTKIDTADPDQRMLAAVPLSSAAHTGEDIAAYARGPGSSRLRGLMDHPGVFQVMREAMALPAS